MDLYEHMGKDLFRAYGIPTPLGRVCRTPGDAAEATQAFGGKSVVKVQVQVGGRGKGGGVVLVDSAQRASEEAARLMRDGFQGHEVDRVLVEELLPITREFYTSFLLDRSKGEYLAMMTSEGGVDIETLAHEQPEAIRRVHVDPMLGLRTYHVRELVGVLPPDAREGAAQVLGQALRDALGVRRDARRGEPARAARGRPGGGARREGDDRRQRALPPARPGRADKAVPDRPGREAREGRGPAVREARGRGRDHRQRRRPRDVDARRRGAGGREGRELPGRRGRGERRHDGDLARGDPVGPGREGGVHQHLRRDHALRRRGERGARGARAGRGRPCRRAPARRDERRRGAADHRRGRDHPRIVQRPDDGRGRRGSRRLAKGGEAA